MPLEPKAVQALTAAPQAAQTVATAAAPKPRTPAPARPAGGAPAPARKEAPVAPTGQVGRANEDLLAQVRGEQDVARQARYGGLVEKEIPNAAGTPVKQLRFAENEDPTAFYARKLEDVARFRKEGAIGPRPGWQQGFLMGDYVPPGPDVELQGVQSLGLAPKEGRGISLSPTEVESPMAGPGGALDSVAAFRKRAEELGVRYREAKRARAAGEDEIEQAKQNPATSRSTDLPRLAAAQRARTQEFVNAREVLRQFGFSDEEMKQKFGY